MLIGCKIQKKFGAVYLMMMCKKSLNGNKPASSNYSVPLIVFFYFHLKAKKYFCSIKQPHKTNHPPSIVNAFHQTENNMKKVLLTLSLIVCFAAAMYGQRNYKSAIGLRFGSPVSVSYKTFISEPGAIEIFGGFRGYSGYSWFAVGGLYQHHMDFPNVEGLNWYFGGGASVFFWNFDNNFNNDDASNTSFGILGCLGLDYKFANAPVNLSLDWVPTVFVNGFDSGFGAGYGALSARYVLN